jgi:hypothetical protein
MRINARLLPVGTSSLIAFIAIPVPILEHLWHSVGEFKPATNDQLLDWLPSTASRPKAETGDTASVPARCLREWRPHVRFSATGLRLLILAEERGQAPTRCVLDTGEVGAEKRLPTRRLRDQPDVPAGIGLQHVGEVALVEDTELLPRLHLRRVVWKTSDCWPPGAINGLIPPPPTAVT